MLTDNTCQFQTAERACTCEDCAYLQQLFELPSVLTSVIALEGTCMAEDSAPLVSRRSLTGDAPEPSSPFTCGNEINLPFLLFDYEKFLHFNFCRWAATSVVCFTHYWINFF